MQRLLLAAIVGTVALGTLVLLGADLSGQPRPIQTSAVAAAGWSAFQEASASSLSKDGFAMSPVTNVRAPVTQHAAEQAALASKPSGWKVRSSHLVRLPFAGSKQYDGVEWAVSVMSPDGFVSTHSERLRLVYSIVFVDAGTGRPMITTTVSGARP